MLSLDIVNTKGPNLVDGADVIYRSAAIKPVPAEKPSLRLEISKRPGGKAPRAVAKLRLDQAASICFLSADSLLHEMDSLGGAWILFPP